MLIVFSIVFVFFFKQKTAYEMRISDWSSDVCSSDLSAAYYSKYRVLNLSNVLQVERKLDQTICDLFNKIYEIMKANWLPHWVNSLEVVVPTKWLLYALRLASSVSQIGRAHV